MIELSKFKNIVGNRERLRDRWYKFPAHMDFYSDALVKGHPKKFSTVIVLPFSRPYAKPDWAKIIAISNFRAQYSVIEEMAQILAPAVVEMGVVPLIVPIAEKSFREMTWSTPIVAAMTKHGILLYDREQL